MCQQWLSIAGQFCDVIGFLIIAYEWWRTFTHERDKRLSQLQAAYERDAANEHGNEIEDYDDDRWNWRMFQRLFLAEWRLRKWLFGLGAGLVILGFLLQIAGSWPGGAPISNFRAC